MLDLGYQRTPCPLIFEMDVCHRVFQVPAQVVVDNRDAHYREDEEDTWAGQSEADITEWAANNMNWEDVAPWAYEVATKPNHPTADDFQDAWMGNDGEITLI
jgi:hypothetical protein